MIYFEIRKNIVTKQNNGISTDDIVTFNEFLENVSTAIVELTNIDESSHKQEIVFLNMEKLIKMNTQVLLIMMGFHIKKIYI